MEKINTLYNKKFLGWNMGRIFSKFFISAVTRSHYGNFCEHKKMPGPLCGA